MTKLKNFYQAQKQKVEGALFTIFSFIFLASYAHADYDIGGPDSGPWAKITEFVQDVVNLVDGPVALVFSFFSIAGMALTWALAPKFVSALGVFARITIAIVVILNIGAWIAAYQS